MKSRFLPVILLSLMVVSGCSFFNKEKRENDDVVRDRNLDYRKAEEIKGSEVPPDLTQQTADFKDALPIPNPPRSLQRLPEDFSLPRPRRIAAELIDTEPAFIQNVEDQRWLVLESSASQTWPQLLSFCEANNLTINFADPARGIMETSWIDAGNASNNVLSQRINSRTPRAFIRPSQDRFQFRMEQGLRRGRTEVHIIHMGSPTSLAANNSRPWPVQSDSLNVERAVLDELKEHIDNKGNRASAFSLAAQSIKLAEKAKLDNQIDGTPVLRLNLDFARSWIVVGQALRNAFIPITDLNRDSGVYFVDVSKQGQDPSKEQRPDGLITKIISDLNKKEEVLPDIWQVKLEAERDGIVVFVRKQNVAETPKDTSAELLALIKEYAS